LGNAAAGGGVVVSNVGIVCPGSLRQDYGLDYFIETGCHLGDGVLAAYDAGFEHVYTCDLDPEKCYATSKRFMGREIRPVVVCAESDLFLIMCSDIGVDHNFYWLDAHLASAYGVAQSDSNAFPLLNELEAIWEYRGFAKSVVAIDDAWLFPDVEIDWTADRPPAQHVFPFTLALVNRYFEETHNCTIIRQDQGIALFTPRAPLIH
jgi:hypothetical protein